ncbi:MAG: hypothetical protein N3D82_03680 [Ignisphaera sp.]|nr:hypothetical protein [Ignisphaera sp.]MCX8168107.1 hypothetical protein [Ignisphaera sp.]MDW8085458.1 hypothetical protein [Ignisphaera sp.]
MTGFAALVCGDEYEQVLDMLAKAVGSIVIAKRFYDLAGIQGGTSIFLSLGCCVEFEELLKLVNSGSSLSIIVYSPTAKINVLSNYFKLNSDRNFILFAQPIIGLIRMILSRSKMLLDYIKIVKVLLNYGILNNVEHFYSYSDKLVCGDVTESRKTFIDHARDVGMHHGVGQIYVQPSMDSRPIEISIEGVQFNKEKKITYKITEGTDVVKLLVAELYSYIQLITSKVLGRNILLPENVGEEEGLFTYYMGNFTSMIDVQIDIEFNKLI